ncbi:MAG: glycerate kinase [Clostridiales bacterium]|nr:glycerate kinase [Clostridiales bacterium]
MFSKYVLIPDSFKGTMSSAEICEIMSEVIKERVPGAEVRAVPVADGGEGSVDAFLRALGGEKVTKRVKGPFGEEMDAFYGLINDRAATGGDRVVGDRAADGGGKTAVVEMAACAGLPLVEGRPDPTRTTTFGVGQLMLDAARRGVKKIIVGLGGSATNDGGCGAAAAAGVRFYDSDGRVFVPVGGTLSKIERIDVSGFDTALRGVEIITMCDIDNPLYGPEGAAAIFGPQKGADARMIEQLDAGLRNLDAAIERCLQKKFAKMPGAGAAGGMGAGMAAFFGSELRMGIEVVLDTVRFDELIAGADLILTGEGKIDGQSLRGKVVIGVARRAKGSGVPVAAIVGDIGDGAEGAYQEGVAGIFSINRRAEDFSVAKRRSKEDLRFTVENLVRFCGGAGVYAPKSS